MRPLFLMFILLVSSSSKMLAADLVEAGFPGVEKLMTLQELQMTGVADLSAAQVRALNDWLINYTAKDAPALIQNSAEVKSAQDKPINSRILGTFKGWRGTTRVTLENGETWQQRHPRKWIVKLENPEVIIDKNLLGFYRMTFVKQGKTVGVKKIN